MNFDLENKKFFELNSKKTPIVLDHIYTLLIV